MRSLSHSVFKRASDRETYVVAVDDVAPVYSFLVNASEGEPGAFNDRLRLEIVGTFQAPSPMRGRRCNIQLLGDRSVTRQLNQPDDMDVRPTRLGDLAMGPEGGVYRGLFPQDALFQIAGLIGQGLLRCVEFIGQPLNADRADIDELNFRLISVHAAA